MQPSLFRPDCIHENTAFIVPLLTEIYSSGLLCDRFTSRTEFAGLSLIWFADKYPTLFTETHTLQLKRVISEFQDTEPTGYTKYRIIHAVGALLALGDYHNNFGLFWEVMGHGTSDVRLMGLEVLYFVAKQFHISDPYYNNLLRSSLRNGVLGVSSFLYLAHRMRGEQEDRIRLAEELAGSEEYPLSSDAIAKFRTQVEWPIKLIENPFANTVEEVQAFIIDTLFFGVW